MKRFPNELCAFQMCFMFSKCALCSSNVLYAFQMHLRSAFQTHFPSCVLRVC